MARCRGLLDQKREGGEGILESAPPRTASFYRVGLAVTGCGGYNEETAPNAIFMHPRLPSLVFLLLLFRLFGLCRVLLMCVGALTMVLLSRSAPGVVAAFGFTFAAELLQTDSKGRERAARRKLYSLVVSILVPYGIR